ncbi:endospore germination permease [Bacillus cereus group sp. BfR-BA-01349]|uniref:GerAB/ArcD/ProY family transporter n=1 Tax=Bacillus cereus group sp. BfR-BA-01349 TaxID=2920312 RepID=UPI001F56A1B5
MNSHRKAKITVLEYILCIHTLQIASGILIMPSSIAAIAGTDGWISVILGWGLTSVVGVFIVFLMNAHKEMTFHEILTLYFGRFLGRLLLICYSFYLAFVGFNTLLRAIDIVKVWIFPSVPSYQIVVLLLLPLFVLVRHGVEAISKYNEVVFFLTICLPVLLIFSLNNSFHPLNVLPVIKEGWKPIFIAMKETITPYAGLEIAYFLYPFLSRKDKAMQGILIANTLTLIVFLYVTLLCYVYLSPEGIKHLIWPVFHLLKGIQFDFLERFEIIYIAYYLFMFSTTIIPYLFFATTSMQEVFREWKQYNISLILSMCMTFCVGYFHFNLNMLLKIYEFTDFINIIFFVVIPTLLFIYTLAKGTMKGRWR